MISAEASSIKIKLENELEKLWIRQLELPFTLEPVESIEEEGTLFYSKGFLSTSLFAQEKMSMVSANFLSEKMIYRTRQPIGRKQPFIKALGSSIFKKGVFDLTGGFAVDAFLLACSDIQVCSCERNSLIFALVKDGLRRFFDEVDESLLPIQDKVKHNLKFIWADGIQVLEQKNIQGAVVYLDPMFPEKKKRALSSKSMQCLQKWVGVEDEKESIQLLSKAMSVAGRVVVKRPDKSKPLLEQSLSQSFHSKTLRFDMYLGKKTSMGELPVKA